MLSRLRIVLVAIVTLVFPLSALAESATVPAGRTTVLGFWYTYNRLCQYGSKPVFKLTKQPEHGTLRASWQAYKMGDDTRNCRGKFAKGMLITYTPNRGFHGADVVKFTLSGSGVQPGMGLGRGFRYDLTVR